MVYDEQVGTADIRTQLFDKTVKGFATAMYKFKQAVTISPTSAWKNFYYRESPTALTGQSGNAIKGIPRGAAFPQAVVSWEKVQTTIEKYGLEDFIHWEDILSDDIDVQARTLYRIAEGVVKAVDDEIWNVLTENLTVTNIQSVTCAAGWEQSSAAIIDNLMQAKQKIGEYNYDTANLMCFINHKDHRSMVNYLTEKGAQFPQIGNDMANNGQAGKLVGINLVVSNSVPASYALVVVPKICGTWKELVPMQTTTKEDPYKGVLVRSVEMGVTQLTDPKSCVLLKGTQWS
jgi:hypothetical protein